MVYGVHLNRKIHQEYFFIDGPVQYSPDTTTLLTSDKVKEDRTEEILQIHYKYVHTHFNCLQDMSTNGVLTKLLVYCPFTVCTACLYGKATKSCCNTKTARSMNKSKPVELVGDSVSVNVLVSRILGLIAQISGFLTHQRYQYARVFVDHHYEFTYIHLLKYQIVDESVEAKQDFEAYVESHGVDIKNYHPENGIFRNELWMNHYKDIQQGLSFDGVNARHQNGRADRRIR